MLDWLARTLPKERAGALLHNDYRLDNCLLDTADPARIVAVLDWDMCTRGDPLADLGYLLNYWVEPGDDPRWREIASMPTWRDGFPTRAEAIARYGARTGSDVGEILWYQVFAAFKLAVIIQQIYIRYVRGQTQDARFASYRRRVLGLAEKARVLIGLSREPLFGDATVERAEREMRQRILLDPDRDERGAVELEPCRRAGRPRLPCGWLGAADAHRRSLA